MKELLQLDRYYRAGQRGLKPAISARAFEVKLDKDLISCCFRGHFGGVSTLQLGGWAPSKFTSLTDDA